MQVHSLPIFAHTHARTGGINVYFGQDVVDHATKWAAGTGRFFNVAVRELVERYCFRGFPSCLAIKTAPLSALIVHKTNAVAGDGNVLSVDRINYILFAANKPTWKSARATHTEVLGEFDLIGNHSIVVEIKDMNCGLVRKKRERKKERKRIQSVQCSHHESALHGTMLLCNVQRGKHLWHLLIPSVSAK